jgi:hypothetical protein
MIAWISLTDRCDAAYSQDRVFGLRVAKMS